MHIEFTTVRDVGYARNVLGATLLRSRIQLGLLGVLMVGAGAVSYRPDQLPTLVGGSVLLGLGLCWILKVFILVRQMVGRLPPSWFGVRTTTLTDEELAWDSGMARGALRWELVAKARSYPFGVVLWQVGGLASWDIPREGMTPEQEAELTAFLTGRGLLRGGTGGPGPTGPVDPAPAVPADPAPAVPADPALPAGVQIRSGRMAR